MKRVLFLATIIICFSGNVKARSGPANLGFVGYLTLGAGYGDSAGSDNHNAEGAPSSLKILS